MLLTIRFGPATMIMFLIVLFAVSGPTSCEHEQKMKQNIITRKIRTFNVARTSAAPIDTSAGNDEIIDERTHICRESALAFYESCFKLSIEWQETAANSEFLSSFWEACSKLTIANFRLCVLSDN